MHRARFFQCVSHDASRHLDSWHAGRGLFTWLRLVFLCPGFQLAFSIRLQYQLARIPLIGRALRRVLWYVTAVWFNCEVDPGATFGSGIYFPHPTAIVIGGEWDIGSNVSILQGVTLGRGAEQPTTRPRIGDFVQLTAGAKVIGAVNIGSHAVIGANAVVLQDVPAGAVAVGVPARVLRDRRPLLQAQPDLVQTLQ